MKNKLFETKDGKIGMLLGFCTICNKLTTVIEVKPFNWFCKECYNKLKDEKNESVCSC